MSYYLLKASPTAGVTIKAYIVDHQYVRILCTVPNRKYSSLIIHWQYRYELDENYNRNIANLIVSNEENDIWETYLKVTKFDFNFILSVKDKQTHWISEVGMHETFKETLLFPFIVPRIRRKELENYIKKQPDWTYGCTLYEIFVDRYRKHQDVPEALPWQMLPPKNDFYHKSVYGGSFQGIIHSMVFDGNYLKELGIGGIYMTPVFEAPSNHKYDTSDYYSIDPKFGNEADLINLVKVAHQNGIKVVLDIALNHCSNELRIWCGSNRKKSIKLFEELKKTQNSKFKEWVVWKNEKEWIGFANLSHMPILNTDHEECADYLINVVKYWTAKLKIDAWRLDVANELGHDFIRNLKKVIREVSPEIWLLGEILHDGDSFLHNDELDSVTNHCFRDFVIEYLRGSHTAEQFDIYLQKLWLRYPVPVLSSTINYLSNHDTARILTALNSENSYSQSAKLSILAAILLFTSYGIPMVYYGDEIGMEGDSDPDCRRCMEWDQNYWNRNQLEFRKIIHFTYTRLIHLRKQKPWLNYASWKTILCSGSLYVYKRYCNEKDMHEEIIVVINPSKKDCNISLGHSCSFLNYRELLSDKKYHIKDLNNLKVSAYNGYVFCSGAFTETEKI